MNTKFTTRFYNLLNRIILLCLITQLLGITQYSVNASNNPSKLETKIPEGKIIYYPFDEQTTASFPNKNYGFSSTHQNNWFYSIDFVLQSNYGGESAYIYPIASGTVIEAKELPNFGNVVYISHLGSLGEQFVSVYAHMKDLPFVVKGAQVTVNTRLGIQGNTGTSVTHLHLSLVHCAPPLLPTEALKSGGGNCTSVRLEPLIGKYANEKFDWWPRNNGAHNQGIGTYNSGGNRNIASSLLNDTTPPEEGWWNSGTTSPNSPTNPLSPNQPIIFDIHAGDNGSGIGEIRLTANYSGWHPNPEGAWRIIARCRPQESSECSGGNWIYYWNWATESKPFNNTPNTPLEIPWMTGIQTIKKNSGNQSVCISFDVFDLAGNPRYAPQGAQCNYNAASSGFGNQLQDNVFNINASTDRVTNLSLQNDSRLIYINTGTPTLSADQASFINDVTIPDGNVVSANQALVKTWRVKNSGTSTWSGYKLKFVDGEKMGGQSEVSIPTTAPGQTVDLTVNLVAPSSNGSHSGSWQVVNSTGGWVSGGKLWVTVNIQSQSSVITLSTDPSSPASASQVNIYAKVNNFQNLRALRILVDGQQICEIGAPEIQNCIWHTNGYASGQHSIVAEADDWTGSSWDKPERNSILFNLTGSGIVNHAPYRPALVQNPAYDWYVTIGNAPQLCAQQQGDPDGNPITQYRFVASASVGTVDSGWVGSSCYTFSSVTPGTYEWHAQVKDSLGGISDWSDSWHFSVSPSGIDTTISHFSVGSPSNAEQIKVFACTTGHAGINIAMRVLVNEANDGTDSGKWNIIKEQGSPCFTDVDAPVWNTLGYENGPHLVRVVAWASQPDAGDVYDTVFTLNNRRPHTPRLIAPIPFSENFQEAIYLNTRTITFKWGQTLRATSYILHVSTNPSPKDDPNPIFRQTFNSSVLQHTFTFGQDYPTLYWQVEASNSAGSNTTAAQRFGIDRQIPACAISTLPTSTYSSVFQVNWNGTDNLSGIQTTDIQFMDSERGTWEDWLTGTPASKTYDLFTGQLGHTYFFKCRTMDNANNAGSFPNLADTSIVLDPFTRPGTPWWDAGYSQKRNIVILNNMSGMPLPEKYPIHLHFDNSTTPTASELYNASLSSAKCNDLRVIYNDTIELDRVVQKCTSSAIDIWFRSQISLTGGSSDNSSHQLYYGNSNAGLPPAIQGNVFYPATDANTVAVWYMAEGQGSTLNDFSENSRNCTIYSPTTWVFPTKFPGALNFSGGSDSPTVNCGTSSSYNLQNFTFETYFKSTNNSSWGRMAGHVQPSSQRWILEMLDNKPSVWIWTTNGDVRINVDQAYNDNLWHHLAFTVNGTQVKIYIDGQLKVTGNLPANIRSDNLPLTIGSTENIMRTFNEMTGVRLSNIVRTDFSYGAFVNILNEPSAATDTVVVPPIIGESDLTILNLSTYPDPQGGVLVEAIIKNEGNLSTESNVYTDLYLGHIPNGPGDYQNSLRFWINEAIEPDETVVLTTVIAGETITNQIMNSLQAATPFSENSGTLYAQTDSAGLVQETNKQNNIYTEGVQFCVATSDNFENDNTFTNATQATLSNSQTHNFNTPEDQDWIKFNVANGKTYAITTANLGISSDTYLYLYNADGETLLSSNDDTNGSLESRIEWTAPYNGIAYIAVKHWNPNSAGCGTHYNLKIEELQASSPSVLSIARASSNPTSTASVNFTVTFSEAVQNVDVNDFSLFTSGVSGATITGITPVSASVYTVAVNTGSGNGTIRLDIPNTASITGITNNLLGGLPFNSGEAYNISRPSTAVLFVKPNGLSSGACNNWGNACELQFALSESNPGNEIWVAAGTYKPTISTDRTISFVLINGVEIYGGFAGNETLRNQRVPSINISILSGDIGSTGVTTDNSYHVVIGTNIDSTAILDGFTIMHGNGNGAGFHENGGGGVYNNNSSPRLINLIVTDNSSSGGGGGMFNYISNPDISNSIFKNNVSVNGGALLNNSSDPAMTNIVFDANTGHNGGAIFNDNGSAPLLNNITISNNKADYGGGVFNEASSPTFINVTISNNNAIQGDGGMTNANNSNPILNNVTISGNTSSSFGVIRNYGGSNPEISNSILWNNSAGIININELGHNNIPIIHDSVIQGGCPSGSVCTNIINADPILDPLADNGGYSKTMKLGFGSSAIDTGGATINCASTDQRGVERPLDGNDDGVVVCDVGAYEYEYFPVDTAPLVGTIERSSTSPTSAASMDFIVTFSEPVTGVDANGADFTLTASSGLPSAVIAGVTPVSDSIYTVTVNTGAGSGTLRLDVPVSASIQDLNGNQLTGLPFTSGQEYIKTASVTYKSNATNDGWITESSETSNTGGTMNSTNTTLLVGDASGDKQIRTILDFDTSSLPNNAIITSASIKMMREGISGSDPFSVLGSLYVDMKNPSFGSSPLELGDFSTAAKKVKMGIFNPTPVSGWYSVRLTTGGMLYINRTGATQFRLYFSIEDNDDLGADFIRFFSGNANAVNRPKLIIQYYVP